ncbi:hypothetical protein [Amycolatopsis sp. 195334CR]|uniref:hypothetical protein n=1 Tax=Amycolatopsis sp. 195334CR TaxID=2814588 RepID=UPI001A8E5088|nr:hypothetical protein [Amycolatopsis sp. 195334CR]MBN6040066.1 hypothetical protein [Amycolatopsis sp. 195334CR]
MELLLAEPDRKLLHLIVQIDEPGVEDPLVRGQVDALLAQRKLDPVATVVNTVFPASLAAASDSPQHLADRYRSMYRRIRREHPANRSGTYFGRLVEHPTDGSPVDQLNRMINRLRSYGHKRASAATVYEGSLSIAVPEPRTGETDELTLGTAETSEDGTRGLSAPFYSPRTDSMPLGFPCLAHISFQHTGDRLHAIAHYRSQYLVQRGYGNYLALGLLQRYIAESAGYRTGTLTVTTGQAEADGTKGDIQRTLDALTQLPLFGSKPKPSEQPAPLSRQRRPAQHREEPGQRPLLPDQP